MTPADFRAARKSLGLTIPRLAALLGKNERTIRRWESGDWPIDKAVEMLMPRLVAEADRSNPLDTAGHPAP